MGILEQHRRGRLVVAGLIALGFAAALLASWWWGRSPGTTGAARPIPGEGGHVVVEVLNPTSTVGLARAATRLLRDAGIDVVYFGSDTGQVGDSTQVIVRRGGVGAGTRVARALGVRTVRQVPDAGRLVDVTVRLGRDLATRLASQNP